MTPEFNLPTPDQQARARTRVARYAVRPRSEVSVDSLGDIAHAEIQIAKEEDALATQKRSALGNAAHEVVVYLNEKKLNLAMAGSLTVATVIGARFAPAAWELTKAKESEVVAACDNAVAAQIPLMKELPSQSELDEAKKACRQLAWRALDIAEDSNPLSNPRKLLGIGYMFGLVGAGLGALASWASHFDYRRGRKESPTEQATEPALVQSIEPAI